MLKMILTVPVIMGCSLIGTVGIIKIIKKITPGNDIPKDPISRKLEEERKRFKD